MRSAILIIIIIIINTGFIIGTCAVKIAFEFKWIIIIVIIIVIISYMQGIYTYIPETNYVSREYSVAAILLLLFHGAYIVISSVESLVLLH